MFSLNNIMVLSTKCQGLRTDEKRIHALSYMKETGASIVYLQDTHLTEREINQSNKFGWIATLIGLGIIQGEWLFF